MSETENIARHTLDRVEKLIWEHQGRNEAISSLDIAESVNTLSNSRKTRRALRALVFDRQVPIVSCSEGYFVVETQDELDEYADSLAAQAQRVKDRRSAVIRAAYDSGQVSSLDDGDGDGVQVRL